jgi:hypothetical protein
MMALRGNYGENIRKTDLTTNCDFVKNVDFEMQKRCCKAEKSDCLHE